MGLFGGSNASPALKSARRELEDWFRATAEVCVRAPIISAETYLDMLEDQRQDAVPLIDRMKADGEDPFRIAKRFSKEQRHYNRVTRSGSVDLRKRDLTRGMLAWLESYAAGRL